MGLLGNDILNGKAGNDILLGGFGKDVLNGDEGNDILDGGWDNDVLSGGNGNDQLWGDWGNDQLSGGAGDDRLVGGLGKDILWGNAGADRFDYGFVFDSLAGEKCRDVIQDFMPGEDKIDLQDIDANLKMKSDQDFTFISTATFDGHAGQLRFDSTNHLLQADLDGNRIADFEISLVGVDHITAADLIL